MNIVTRDSWKALKKKVYYQLVCPSGKEVLKAYKIDKEFKPEEKPIHNLMDQLSVGENYAGGFIIWEDDSMIVNLFQDQKNLRSIFYSTAGEGLEKAFEVDNFEFEGIRKEIANHEIRAWQNWYSHKDKSTYLNDIFTN